jgi:tetratricopeptide (TPR) repeat protein
VLNQSPPHLRAELAEAEQALNQQEFDTCIQICDGVLAQDAVNLPAHLFRGVASGQVGKTERAIMDLSYVLERQPEHVQAALFLGQSLRRKGLYDPALAALLPLLKKPEVRRRALFEIAICHDRLNHFQRAIGFYNTLLSEDPRNADAAANLAVLLEKTNQLDEAMNWAERALMQAAGNVIARLTRARVLRRQGEREQAIKELEELLEGQLSYTSRTIVLNQLGQCLDAEGKYAEAFARFSEANEIQKTHNPEAVVDDFGSYGIELARFLRQWLKEHPPADWSETPEDDREPPVFLVGFPRSGTTLLDQALTAHPKIEVIEERELMLEVRRKWISVEHFNRIQDMTPDEVHEARKLYRSARAAAHNNPDASVIVDKLPLNSMYLPLICRLFPEARILLAQRDPRDVVLSCFFQNFQLVGAMPYFLDLENATAYYDVIMSMLSEALEVLPLAVHRQRYEDLVNEYEGSMREIIGFLGLDWDDRVLDHRSGQQGREITTPSYQQVSQPLYTRSIGRWQNYARQLEPFLPDLDPWIQRFGYAPSSD